MPPKVISGGDNPYDIHDAKLSSSATAHESSSVTAHEISNRIIPTFVGSTGIVVIYDNITGFLNNFSFVFDDCVWIMLKFSLFFLTLLRGLRSFLCCC